MATNKFFPSFVKKILPFAPVVGVVSTCLLVASAVAQVAEPIINAGWSLQVRRVKEKGLFGVDNDILLLRVSLTKISVFFYFYSFLFFCCTWLEVSSGISFPEWLVSMKSRRVRWPLRLPWNLLPLAFCWPSFTLASTQPEFPVLSVSYGWLWLEVSLLLSGDLFRWRMAAPSKKMDLMLDVVVVVVVVVVAKSMGKQKKALATPFWFDASCSQNATKIEKHSMHGRPYTRLEKKTIVQRQSAYKRLLVLAKGVFFSYR